MPNYVVYNENSCKMEQDIHTSASASEVEEAQLVAAMEAGEWYDSDSDSEGQESDSVDSSSAQVLHTINILYITS